MVLNNIKNLAVRITRKINAPVLVSNNFKLNQQTVFIVLIVTFITTYNLYFIMKTSFSSLIK